MKIRSIKNNSKIGWKLRRTTTRVVITTLLITALPLIGLFSVSYLKNSISQMNVISEQLIQQLNLNASGMISYADQIPNDTQLLSLLSDQSDPLKDVKIENRLMELCGKGANIEGIILSCEAGNYHSVFIEDSQMDSLLHSGWYQDLQQREYLRYFSAPDEEKDVFYYCTYLENISPLSGTLTVIIRSYDLVRILKNADKTFSHYIWLNNQNVPILNRQFGQEDYLFSLLNGPSKNNFFDKYIFYNQKGLFISYHSDIARWKFVSFIPYIELLSPFLPIFFVLIISIIIIMLLSSRVLRPLIQNLVSPIETLSSHMHHFSYDEPCLVDIHTGDEIEELSLAFNEMSLELKRQIEMLLEEQKKEQKMKYGLRISQINPHFIYNTMNTITYLARKNRSEDIVVINNALIHIMKDSLRINESSVLDSVETEVNVTCQYLTIQEYRYEEKIRIIWEVDPQTLPVLIPKHIIQPLVENAIVHGFLDDGFESLVNEMPFIRIAIAPLKEKPGICMIVEDNGAGIDMAKYEQICHESELSDAPYEYHRGKHIGLANIKYRLSYLLGERQELTISPRAPHGTCVSITLLN